MTDSLVDWGMAERVAVAVSGAGDDGDRAAPPLLRPERLEPTCSEALELVRAYSRLQPLSAIPPPEAVGRAEWSRTVLATLRELEGELEGTVAFEIPAPGPLGRAAGSLIGIATGTEVGLAVGYAARRVLGQYEVALVGPERPPRLLLVAPNLSSGAAEMGIGLEGFVRWVALHEVTHALQFAVAPWLRQHLGGLVRELLERARSELGLGELAKRLAADPRRAVSSFLHGDLAAALLGRGQVPLLQRIQATMTVVEGHAEHVMDIAGPDFVGDVTTLRRALDARRARRGPLETILARLLGLDLKLRQYRLGRSFCDAVVGREGVDALNRIWSSPEALPSMGELEQPESWLDRVRVAAGV